jgi:DNA-binding CsgD family transcriptional regulator
MPMVRSRPGVLLVGQKMKPVAWNVEAFQILAFSGAERRQSAASAGELMMSRLVVNGTGSSPRLVEYVQSGKRKYLCRAFQLDAQGGGPEAMSVVILKRVPVADVSLKRKLKEFNLTEREMQVAELLVQGLTNKEIAAHLGISENTVKAFLRLIMAKMEMTTRAGVVGKIVGSNGDGRDRVSVKKLALAEVEHSLMNGTHGMPVMAIHSPYSRRYREGGLIESVCTHCFRLVGSARTNEEVEALEMEHDCSVE